MHIKYSTKKDLPCEQLYNLFLSVGWADEKSTTTEMINNFNIPFINSTIVISACDNDKLVGCVRVLSDKIFRSHIYDLAVLPEYQKQGIGTELVKRCIAHFPNSEWNLETTSERVSFYKQLGFEINEYFGHSSHIVTAPVLLIYKSAFFYNISIPPYFL